MLGDRHARHGHGYCVCSVGCSDSFVAHADVVGPSTTEEQEDTAHGYLSARWLVRLPSFLFSR